MPNEKNIVNTIGMFFFGTIVVLTAVAGVILLIGGTGSFSIPYIEGGGGNQNPLVGISNAITFADNAVMHLAMLWGGGIMLLISVVGIVIWRASHRIRRIAAPIYAVAWVALMGSSVNDLQHPAPSIRSEVISAVAEMRDERARYSVLYENMKQQWRKYRKPHDPGPFTEYYIGGEKGVEGHYDLNGKMDGQWTRFHRMGWVEWEGTFVDGQPDGTLTIMDSGRTNEKKEERVYVAGSIQVTTTGWYPNGQKVAERVRLANGDTESFRWYENGQLRLESLLVDGERQGSRSSRTEWHRNGQKSSETNYVNGSPVGTKTSWYANGQKSSEDIYRTGHSWSTISWHENGQQKSEENRVGGELDGALTTWYANGQIKREAQLERGREIGDGKHWTEAGEPTTR